MADFTSRFLSQLEAENSIILYSPTFNLVDTISEADYLAIFTQIAKEKPPIHEFAKSTQRRRV